MERTKNSVRNMAWGTIQRIMSLLLPFTTRTLLIKFLGSEYLGLSSLFTSVLSILSLAELGVASAIVVSMYKPIADGDTETICLLMNFYKKAYRIIGSIVLVAGIAVSPFLKFFIKGSVPDDINLYILFYIYLLNTSFSYFLFAYKNCLFSAHQRNDVSSKVHTLMDIALHLIQIVFIIAFRNYYTFVIVIPVCTAASNIIIACFARKKYPDYICKKGALSKELKNDLKKKIGGLMISKISVTARSSIDSLFISMFLGLTVVAMYSNYTYIVTSVLGFIKILESALVAGVGNSIVTEDKEKNYADIKKFTFMLQWVVGWCSICILCLTQPFIKVWLGEEYMFSDMMPVICAAYLFVSGISIVRSIYTHALGIWWSARFLSLIDIFVNIALNYFLVKYFGAYGILAATVIDITFVSIPFATYFPFRDYFGKEKYKYYIFDYIKYFILAAVVGTGTYFLCGLIVFENDWLTLFVRAVVCVIVPNIMYFLMLFKTKQFAASKEFVLTRFFKRKSL